MQTSDSIINLSKALLAAQKAITFAAKDATNPHFKSKYADLPTVIDAIKPALNAAGIVFMQMPAPSESGCIALTTRLMHESGEWIESTATCPLQKQDPQGYGSANTYLRRYALAAAVGLYQDDDDGNAASDGKSPTRGPMHGVRDGIGNDLPDSDKEFLKELAVWVVAEVKKGGYTNAKKEINNNNLDDDQRTYLESQMDSATRSALKKA